MCSSLSNDEKFVIKAVSNSFGGTWRSGEDPPDVYLMQGAVEVAIEISTLTQHVTGKSGTPEPRLSQDMGVIRLCDELNKKIEGSVQPDKYVIITLHAPVDKLRKFKNILKDKLIKIINSGTSDEVQVKINGNDIKVHVVNGQRSSGKKVVGIIANRNSNQNITSNVEFILSHRIQDKTQKCSKVTHRPLWLALSNDYWLAEVDSYKNAMQKYSERHPFDKILLISEKGEVHSIY